WYPWGEEALSLAIRDDRPILLSIGYSACHWCHVMAHESFQHLGTAATMNRLFVNIKVDREERPDLDQIYQAAHQMLTGRAGGWPLTLFLTPDGIPFFAGTYFPPTPRDGLPGFLDICQRVAEAYRHRRSVISEQNRSLQQALESTLPQRGNGKRLDTAALRTAREGLLASIDARNGGFGGAPKFPQAVELGFLLSRPDDPQARQAALTALSRMAAGGICDQLGGGFFRYSVDERWQIPHFEKMLSDNGQLLGLYVQAWAMTGERLFARTADAIATWALREMQLPAGGFCASLDADSAGEEGRYYVWERQEARKILTATEWRVAAPLWGFDDQPNFEGHYWHLHGDPDASGDQDDPVLDSARRKLLASRSHRSRPGRDDKVLTGWNALMISGLAQGARLLDRPEWLAAARQALDFLRQQRWRGGRLFATDRHPAYLDDHAYLIAALLDIMQAEFRSEDMDLAVSLADSLLDRFQDERQGGFFFTAHDHERLIHRPKPGVDGPTPSGNGAAALALLRLGNLLGEARYLEAAQATLRLFLPRFGDHAFGRCGLLLALEENLAPQKIVILRGPRRETEEWRRRLPAADALVLALPNGTADLPAALAKPEAPQVNAWVCSGVMCHMPVTDFDELERVFHSS
ncbi:MAG TPA: thioredoxin domain-containing protein, partial [Rhodocyclaceae bacterium]|nr:thioredoxin domain-containing protein [Rhodocyclaceae bacterium]